MLTALREGPAKDGGTGIGADEPRLLLRVLQRLSLTLRVESKTG